MFLLQNIPIVKGNKIWGQWHNKISNFIWAGKKPSIKFKVFMDERAREDLQVPNFKLREWIVQEDEKLLNLEGFNKKLG